MPGEQLKEILLDLLTFLDSLEEDVQHPQKALLFPFSEIAS